ncbi:MAG: zinc ABC transporter substrate-binding protein [Syntrophomonadaceae bacterium]|nr:zinc ABC transporter substrate-binding protein [Syntrophomonadaceae bacterium]
MCSRFFKRFACGLSLLILLGAVLLTTSGCGEQTPTNSPASNNQSLDNQLKVVTTIFPLADITQNLGGDQIKVINLLPAGANPHTYEPTPSQMKEVAGASLIIGIGAGLDEWVQKLALAANQDANRIEVAEGLQLLASENDHAHEGHSAEADHLHVGADPHIWLDPVLVRDHVAPKITEALIKADPSAEAVYQANLLNYQNELTQLHQEYLTTMASLTNKKYISFHASWRYLAQRYGLEEVASIEPAPGQEPSGKWITEVVNLARANEVRVIIAEPQFNPRMAEVIAGEFAGRVITLDPLGGESAEGRNTYLNLMRYNLNSLKTCL